MKKGLLLFVILSLTTVKIGAQPNTVSGLVAWYGSDSVVLSGTQVVSMVDKSGNGLTASQTNPGWRPTLVTNQLNGKPVVRFDGVASGLETTGNLPLSNTAAITVFAVYKDRRLDGSIQMIYENSIDFSLPTYQTFGYLLRSPDGVHSAESATIVEDANVQANTITLVSPVRDTNPVLATQLMNKTPSPCVDSIYFSGQGVSYYSNTDQTYTSNYSTYPLNIGWRANGPTFWWAGDLAELIFYNCALSSTERHEVEQYLRLKYAPQVSLGPNIVKTYGVCAVNLNIGSGFTHILWSTGATTPSISVTESGTYWVSVQDMFGYTDRDTISVTLPYLGMNSSADTTICYGSSLNLQPQFSPGGYYHYLWSPGGTTGPSLNVTTAGSYYVKITDTTSTGCSVYSDTILVSMDTFPKLRVITKDTSICQNSSLAISALAQSQAKNIMWSTGTSGPSTVVSASGNVSVTVTDNNGCVAKDTADVSLSGVAPNPAFTFDTVCSGGSTVFTNKSTPSDSIIKYHWNFGDGDTTNIKTPTHAYTSGGAYNVALTAYTNAGCINTLTESVPVNASPTVSFNNSAGCVNVPYAFQNNSIAGANDSIISWLWTFGDGSPNSTVQSPQHSYTSANNYNVSLAVSTLKGCAGQLQQSLNIVTSALPPGVVSLSQPVNGYVTTGNTITFSWSAAKSAVRYLLTLAADAGFTDILNQVTTSTLRSTVNLGTATTVYWKVTAYNSCSDSSTSPVYLLNVFSTSSISCLSFWIDGNSAQTNGAKVPQWNDLSGNGLVAAQGNPTNQPTLLTNQLNGYNVVHFDGVTSGLKTGNINFSNTQGITTFLVYRDRLLNLNGNVAIVYENSNDISAPNYQSFAYVQRTNAANAQAEGITITGDANTPANTVSVSNIPSDSIFVLSSHVMNKKISPAEDSIYFSGRGVSQYTNTDQTYTTNFSTYPMNIGARDSATSLWWEGDIAEMLMYCNALGTQQRTEVEQYLRFKYAPQINLGFDTTIAYGFCPYNLTVAAGITNIKWSTGATGNFISINQSGKYWVTGTDAFGYTTTDTIYVTYPFEGLNFTDTAICLGSSITIQPQFTSPGKYNYLWNNGDTTSSITVSKSGYYSCKITDANGCFIQSDSAKVAIDSFSLNRLFSMDTTLCKFSNFAVNPSVQSFISKISWSTGDSTVSIILSTSGNVTATATDINGCTATNTINVTFNGTAPTTLFTNSSACSGSSMLFTDLSVGVSPDVIVRSHWNFGDGDTVDATDANNPSPHLYANPGTYPVSLTSYTQEGCQSSYTKGVTVNPSPVVNFNNSTGCINTPYQFTDLSVPASGDTIISWSWSFGNGNTSTSRNPTNSYNTAAQYNVMLTVQTSKGCTASVTKALNIVVSALPPGSPSLLLPINNYVTTSHSVGFSWNLSANAVLYRLSLATDPYFYHVFSTQYTTGASIAPETLPYDTVYWQVTAFNSCNDSSSSGIYVVHVFNANSISCLQFWVDGSSVEANGTKVTQWSDMSGNGTSAVQNAINSQPTLLANRLNGNSVVYFDGAAGLRTDSSIDLSGTNAVTVFMVYKNLAYSSVNPEVIYEHSDDLNQYPQTFSYDLRGDLGYNEAVSIKGDPGINNTLGVITTPRDTNFVLSAQLMDKSQSPATADIYFSGKPVSQSDGDYTYTTTFAKYPLNIGARDNASQLNWTGDIAEMMIYCQPLDSLTRYGIEQYLRFKYAPQIYLGPDIHVAYGVCDTMLSIGPYFKNIRWSTGDSTNSILVKQAGTYWVTANDIFGYITSDTIHVYFPYLGANVGNSPAICLYDSLLLIQQIQPVNAYSFVWQNGSTSDSLYAKTPGKYYTQITDTNHCVLYTDTINVSMDSFQLQTLISDTSVCTGDEITISLNNYVASSILWSNNDTTAAIEITAAGAYSVTVTDINSCVAQGAAQIGTHGQTPSVNFRVQNLCEGDTTQMTDLTVPVSPDQVATWQWVFGDDDSSSAENPAHVYEQLGDYTIQLYVLTDSGCSGEKAMQIAVSPSPKADFYYPSTSLICAGDTEQFYNTSTILLTDTIVQSLWVFNTVDSFYTASVTYAFPAQGNVPVKLVVTSNEGCSDSFSSDIEVFPPLVANFEATNVCFGDSTSFTDITHSLSVISWEWTFGDGSFFSTVQDPKHEYADTGIYHVTMTVINAIGCTSTASKAINIVEPPTAAFTNLVACVNTLYSPVDSSISPDEPITQWIWNINGEIFNTETPSYYVADTGIYQVSLTVTSKSGCTDSTTNTIEVFPSPVAEFTFAPLYGAAPLTVAFTDQSTGAVSFAWNFGDGSPGSFDENPTYTYTQNDTFTIVLSVASAYGCTDSTSQVLIVSETYLDLAVTAVQTKSVIQNDGSSLVSITADMANLGTRLITEITLEATLGSGGVISEVWNGVFESGTTMNYTFASQFVIGASIEDTYICVDAVSVNNGETETDTLNNIQCASLTGGIQLIGPSPNPAYGNAYLGIVLPEAGQVTIDVSDIAGKFIVHNVVLNLPVGRTDYPIPAGQMQSGQYVIRLQYDDNIYTRRFVVQ